MSSCQCFWHCYVEIILLKISVSAIILIRPFSHAGTDLVTSLSNNRIWIGGSKPQW